MAGAFIPDHTATLIDEYFNDVQNAFVVIRAVLIAWITWLDNDLSPEFSRCRFNWHRRRYITVRQNVDGRPMACADNTEPPPAKASCLELADTDRPCAGHTVPIRVTLQHRKQGTVK